MKELLFADTKENIELLQKQIAYAKDNSTFYKEKLASFDLSQFSLEMYRDFPFTTKEDLGADNEAFCCVRKNQIAEYVTTSGTTGEPITIYLTKKDLDRLAINERDSFRLMGCDSDDLFQLLTTIDKQFMAGLAYSLGVQELDAGMIRIGPGVPQLQWEAILKYQPTKLIAVPSFVVTLIDYARENNIDYKGSSVNGIVCIGEPLHNEDLSLNILGKRIKDNWDVELFSTYASTEMGAAFSECQAHQGCHVNENLIYMEVITEDGTEAADGESGEIVVTTLNVEGTPLVRYRTGDIAKVYRDTCSCGRTSPRLGPILGRKKQMIKYKGTTIFPKSIFEVLDQYSEISCYKVVVSPDSLGNDNITILLDKGLENAAVLHEIKGSCKAKLRAVPNMEFIEIDALRGMVYKKHLRKPEKILFQ